MQEAAVVHPLRIVRQREGLTGAQLGAEVGVPGKDRISRFERGDTVPSWELAKKIATRLGSAVVELFGEPNDCGCGCGEPTFSTYRRGHENRKDAETRRQVVELHLDEWLLPKAIAEKLEIDKKTVYGILDEESVPLRKSRTARAVHDRIVELTKQGRSQREISRELHVSAKTVVDVRRAAGLVSTARTGRPPKYPTPEPRVCEYPSCDAVFQPRGWMAVHGWDRFCPGHRGKGAAEIVNAPMMRELWATGKLNAETHRIAVSAAQVSRRRGLEHRDRIAEATGLLTLEQATAMFGVSGPQTLNYYVQRGALTPMFVDHPALPKPSPLFDPHEVKMLLRDLYRSRHWRLDRDRVLGAELKRSAKRGLEHDRAVSAALAAADRAVARRSHAAKLRTSSAERQHRWQQVANELEPEFALEPKASLFEAVALRDWQQHPEDWPRDRWPPNPRDPDDLLEPLLAAAGDRVRKALQITRKTQLGELS